MNWTALGGSVAIGPLIFWIVLLTLKHLLADFFFQTKWIAEGKEAPRDWAMPLLIHCAIHGAMTMAIVLAIQPRLWFIGLADFAIHVIGDRAKGYINAIYGLKPDQAWFWRLLGMDQAYHRLTDFGLALILALAA